MKGLGRTLRIVLIVVLLALIVFSGYNIFKIIMNYHEIDVVADEAVEKYVYVDEDDFPKVDFEALQATNSDVVAWIYIPDTSVNFPVVKGPSNFTYLNLDYQGNYSIAGSIFMDIATVLCSDALRSLMTANTWKHIKTYSFCFPRGIP